MSRKKISLIGSGNIGGTLAHLIAIKELANVILVDIANGIPQGKSLDIAESSPVEGFDVSLKGSNSFSQIRNSDVIHFVYYPPFYIFLSLLSLGKAKVFGPNITAFSLFPKKFYSKRAQETLEGKDK